MGYNARNDEIRWPFWQDQAFVYPAVYPSAFLPI
jgi:hypothetical protein